MTERCGARWMYAGVPLRCEHPEDHLGAHCFVREPAPEPAPANKIGDGGPLRPNAGRREAYDSRHGAAEQAASPTISEPAPERKPCPHCGSTKPGAEGFGTHRCQPPGVLGPDGEPAAPERRERPIEFKALRGLGAGGGSALDNTVPASPPKAEGPAPRYDDVYFGGLAALDDLQRCDGHAPCGACERCGGAPPKAEGARWERSARNGASFDPPQDCGWPLCGCDPYAQEVFQALEEAWYVPTLAAQGAEGGWDVSGSEGEASGSSARADRAGPVGVRERPSRGPGGRGSVGTGGGGEDLHHPSGEVLAVGPPSSAAPPCLTGEVPEWARRAAEEFSENWYQGEYQFDSKAETENTLARLFAWHHREAK